MFKGLRGLSRTLYLIIFYSACYEEINFYANRIFGLFFACKKDDTRIDGAAWWYYFDNSSSTGSTHPIYAGQQLVEGANAQYSNGVLTITLGDNMMLRNVSEPVKIQGYNEGELPTERPAVGMFTTYKGTELEIEIPYYPYYVIHLDVWVCK